MRSYAEILFLSLCLVALRPTHGLCQVSVTTQRYDNARTGQNLSERILNTSNVNSATFGKLFTRAVDAEVFAQPLYIPGVKVPGAGVRNILYVATVKNSVYAFDADDPGAALPLWHVNLMEPGARPVKASEVGQDCSWTPRGIYSNIADNIGIVGTPVIDAATMTLYVVARTVEKGHFFQRLHSLDLVTGADRPNSPVVIAASVRGTGSGAFDGVLSFNPEIQNQRGALLLANGVIYITWASHCDTGPFHGWIMGYDATTLAQVMSKSMTPDGEHGGIWQSNTGPSSDTSGDLYYTVGDGTASVTEGGQGYAQAFVKMAPTGEVRDWFVPHDWKSLNLTDRDVGASGVLLIPDTNLLTSGSKQGTLYLLDRNKLGHFQPESDTQIVQSFWLGGDLRGTPTYWNGPGGPYIYAWCNGCPGQAFLLRHNRFIRPPKSYTRTSSELGGMLSVSANGTLAGTGILWANTGDEEDQVRLLRAFDATDLSHELWKSEPVTRDQSKDYAKFNTPIVANGKVYLATFLHDVTVYGILPKNNLPPTVTARSEPAVVVLPNKATVVGTTSDDGGPLSPGVLTWTWVQVSGPGLATFENPYHLTTNVAFSAPGTYLLRLTVSDGALATNADMTLDVRY